MQEIDVHPPRVEGSRIVLGFDQRPSSGLYRRTSFELAFPPSVPLDRVPRRIVALLPPLVLHLQWALLAPCRVRLLYPLDAPARRLFQRMARQGAENQGLAQESSPPAPPVTIETVERVQPPAPAGRPPRGCAVSFSGGKDSLLHVGLLTELAEDVVLVSVTSPLPPLEDHVSARRRQVLRDVVERRPVRLVEVTSDARSMWENDFSRRRGHAFYVNEVTDTLLYTAALWVVAAALDCGHAFLASENEVSETTARPGGILQHPHFMYAVPTLVALDAEARGAGMRFGSLTSALHSAQVQRLLWTRYPDLRGLQYSCWRARRDQAACSACSQCLRTALDALAVGGDPAEMGIDLLRLLPRVRGWQATAREPFDRNASPDDKVRWRLHAQVVRALREVSTATVWSRLPKNASPVGRWRALDAFRALRRRHRSLVVGPAPGYRKGWLRFVDSAYRDRVAALYAETFPEEPPSSYAGGLARTASLSRMLLGQESPDRGGSAAGRS